ncbi:MAG TPA: DUF5606 domain-containing protein [Chitinophagaceae bacterium]|nr:DUF5606 domain-containing protein [Chitinophagaceae bacterium]
MEYSKIVSVTGLGGLYELIASKADGAVVKSLEDKSSKFVSSRVHNFTHLESIEIYTVKDNTVLAEVFKAIKNSKETLPDAKADGKALKSYFEKVYPDLDFERVYASDMKKIIKWFTIITENKIEIKDKKPDEENDTSGESVIEEIKNQTPVPQEESEKNSK